MIVLSGAWEGTVGVIQAMNEQKQSLSINVELFGRETPVELSFAEVKKDGLKTQWEGFRSRQYHKEVIKNGKKSRRLY